ncbi:FadR/GntR family transcriptional regulator [Streptomyces antimycoticus]|uniref:FCD domain-containing protein n=3 Tax=Streptomyces TaxID=1883 RepID=A0ABD5JB71_9ACTN|nr:MULTISPECIES: FCD domain-containing protein [Streptomyces]MEE4584898.1 FCD domain-containing protein [Streptomyces sp. DSM 41602]KUL44974.1 GntR family transcriptional regulator [Streptomyces violaceusniger]QTI89355.1 FadR family transcriptional regulator [Streptomyces sp. AgN23]RSS40967.1 FadR family transcriptional regulator [Streptomyces sp. WAC05858]WJD97093.1 FCD domain-containing protein [Streptomyces antimycoticus]
MSAVDKAFHGLRHMIASGRLGAGERIPPEADLCEELGVSRGPLREAVRMLAALGVVEPRHGSGTYVSPLRPEDIIGSLSLTLELLPLTGLLEVYEIRRVLEAHIAAKAAARATPEAVEALFSLIEAMEAAEDSTEASELDHRFHTEIARIGGNPTLVSLLAVFRARSRKYQVFNLPDGPELRRKSDEDHRVLAQAIADRDPGAAAGAAESHVAQTERWLRAYMPPIEENNIPD